MRKPQLSTEAIKALVSVGTNRQGAAVHDTIAPTVIKELQVTGLIGNGHGLTRKGTIIRQQIVEAAMEMMF